MRQWCTGLLLVLIFFAGCVKLTTLYHSTTGTETILSYDSTTSDTAFLTPVDWRHYIKAEKFDYKKEGYWLSPLIETPFAFNELIYCWKVHIQKGGGFRLYLQLTFEQDDTSPWLYAGFWGTVNLIEDRRKQIIFDRGKLVWDQLFLKSKARMFRFKVVSEGETPLNDPPSLLVIVTDNHPSRELVTQFADPPPMMIPSARILDIPLRKQEDSSGKDIRGKCQSAALASAMQYFGKTINLEQIIPFTYDPEYKTSGIWPRVIQAAIEFGVDANIDRFRNWIAVRKALAENKVILCSITMPADEIYYAPPYPEMEGHIVALNGITEDGRVVVTDSTRRLTRAGKGFRCQWYVQDFEKIWMQIKGGVGIVICRPKGAPEKLVLNLPPFPQQQRYTAVKHP